MYLGQFGGLDVSKVTEMFMKLKFMFKIVINFKMKVNIN